MQVEFLASFSKDLDKISSGAIMQQVSQLIHDLENAEKLQFIPNTKKLKGHKTAYRIRFGEYRVGLFSEKNIVQLARILHRKDIYKFFP